MELSRKIMGVALLSFLLVLCLAGSALTQQQQDFVAVPYGDIEVIIEPSSSENVMVQVLFVTDLTDNEVYNWHLSKSATSFVIEKGYLHMSKQYKFHMVAFSSGGVPSDPSNNLFIEVSGVQIPAERMPPKMVIPASPVMNIPQ